MRRLAGKLHLASHVVGGKVLDAAGDLEAHQGTDERIYLLDTARALPPEDPRATPHLPSLGNSIFFRLLRPEFMQILKVRGHPALSPDALSGWSKGDPDARRHNDNIYSATKMFVIIF